jgi:hypothetical protein
MALIDFLQSAEKITNTPAGADALATTDVVMAQAAKTQENRMRREELQRKIDNLRKQNDELKARRESLKASTSLSNLDEDKIVAIAKAKGIKDEDIETWLRARQQRSAREISEGQRQELGRGATAQEMANRNAAIQAIFEAKRELAEAKAEEKLASAEMKEAKGEAVAAADNKFETLKAQFEKIHGEKWEDIWGEKYEPVWHKEVKGYHFVGHHWGADEAAYPEADMAEVERDIRAAVTEAVAPWRDPDQPIRLIEQGYGSFGFRLDIRVPLIDIENPFEARSAIVQACSGRSWLARW